MHAAARWDQPLVVQTLIRHNPRINALDKDGDTPILLAATAGHTRCAMILSTEGGADVHQKNPTGYSLLHAASSGDSTELVVHCLERGLDINVWDNWGWSPLHYAAEAGATATVELVINRGAVINAKTYRTVERPDVTYPAGTRPLDIARGQPAATPGRAGIGGLLQTHSQTRRPTL